MAWTPDGTPAAITDGGTDHVAFPGICWLTASTCLLVYRRGSDHAATLDGEIVGRIGTVTGTSVSWAAEFDIYDHASLDVRCEDAASIVDGEVVIAGRHYDGSNSQLPFVLVCDDAPASLSSSSSWTKHDITFAPGDWNLCVGRLVKHESRYIVGAQTGDGSDYSASTNGVLISDSLTDWSSPTYVPITAIGDEFSELCLDETPGGLVALLRCEDDVKTYRSVSTDGGDTWTAPTLAHDGFGFPMFRRLPDGALLSVYRDSPDGDTAWRTSSNSGVSWSSEAILDTTNYRSSYATQLTLSTTDVLCVYAVEPSDQADSDIYSQVFSGGGDLDLAPPRFGIEVGINAPTFTVEADRSVFPARFGIEVGFQAGVVFRSAGRRQLMLTGAGIETPEMTTGNPTAGQFVRVTETGFDFADAGAGVPATTVESETTWGITPVVGTDTEYARQDHTHGTPAEPAGTGAILIADDHSTPLIFADLLQEEDASDLLYFDGG